jgi:hypothetical protein
MRGTADEDPRVIGPQTLTQQVKAALRRAAGQWAGAVRSVGLGPRRAAQS